MLFETKEKADAFIAYNALEILEETGKAPVRSYYCPLCCGYHVTSNPSLEKGERMDLVDEQKILLAEQKFQQKEKKKELAMNLSEPVAANIERARVLMSELQLDEACDLIDDTIRTIQIQQIENPFWEGRGKVLKSRAENLQSLIKRYELIVGDTDAEEDILSGSFSSKNVAVLKVMVQNHRIVVDLDNMISSIEKSFQEGASLEDQLNLIKRTREKLREWKRYANKSLKESYQVRLQQLEQFARTSESKAAKRAKAKKKALLSSISSAEKVASLFRNGDYSRISFHVEKARKSLSDVEDCPEKAQVLAFLDRFAEEF